MKTRILLGTFGLSLTTLVFSLWGTEYTHAQRAHFNYLALVVLGVLLVSYALALGKGGPKVRPGLAALVVAPLLASLTFLDPVLRLPDPVLVVISAAGGAGMLPLAVLWARSLAGLPAKTVAVSAGCALILNHLVHLVLVLLPSAAYAAATALLPLLSSLALFLVLGRDGKAGAPGGGNGPSLRQESGPASKPRLLGRFVAATVMVNVALSFIYMLYRVPGMSEPALSQMEVPATLARVGLLAAIVVLFAVVLRFKLVNYYRCIIVLGVFGFLAFPLLGSANAVPYVLTATSFTCLGIVMWVFPACFSARNRVPADCVIGLTYGPFVALWAITYFTAEHLLSHVAMSAEVLNVVTLCGAGLVVLAYTVVFTEKDLLQALPSRDDLEGIDARLVEEEQLARIASAHALTEREREVLAKLFAGKSRAQVREELCISEGTLNSHTRSIYKKTGVHNRQELVALVKGESDD